MHLLLTDETNLNPSDKSRFFIYGGLIIPFESFEALDKEIAKIRLEAGYNEEDMLKFDTNTRPKHVTFQESTKAKRQVLETCQKLGCKFIAYVILHDIARKQSQDDLVLFGANHVIGRFNRFLEKSKSVGICLTDTLPVKAGNQYLIEKFTKGLKIEERQVKLNQIRLFGSTCIGASHVNSAIDIVLGTFRYCVNTPENIPATSYMMTAVANLMWGEKKNDVRYILETGLILRPILDKIKVASYKDEYTRLIKWLEKLDD